MGWLVGSRYGVVDLFAGPGGLGEGFASLGVGGGRPFDIRLSVEKEASAHKTLRLRSFIRQIVAMRGKLPQEYLDFQAGRTAEPAWGAIESEAWAAASAEAKCVALGTDEAVRVLQAAYKGSLKGHSDTVLIGGPPCQAYSLVGRARANGNVRVRPTEDERHFLFREYIAVLRALRPGVFIMENVKGMLSSQVESQRIFELLMQDLQSLGGREGQLYGIKAIRLEGGRMELVDPERPSDFIVRAEDYGVPQRRHRVIIVGVRNDLLPHCGSSLDVGTTEVTVEEILGGLPKLRSGLSRNDSVEQWLDVVTEAARDLKRHRGEIPIDARIGVVETLDELHERWSRAGSSLMRASHKLPRSYGKSSAYISRWIENSQLDSLSLHETRGHMTSDLGRYLYAACYAEALQRSPKANEFPNVLAPDHRNWKSGIFADRFRVQVGGHPSTTVTSHISKDGHYFIHPDPFQCRSLTVREAARLQSFPDDYLFLGNRTEQYTQVGNAVPPLLAHYIAQLVLPVLGKAKASHRVVR